ncbi:MAG: hypothetical protein ACR2IA_03795 [Pyrinomonadaceae bacterium]
MIDNPISDAESVEHQRGLFVTFGDGALFRQDVAITRYPILFVIFDDKKNADFAIARRLTIIY